MGFKPDGILVSARGGSLLGGVLMGHEAVRWDHDGTVPVAAIEVIGAASLHTSLFASYTDHSAPTPKLASLEARTFVGSVGPKDSPERMYKALPYSQRRRNECDS
ncbi:hypothetical protein BT69DRAFT_1290369 [Atractiella rhizophila]|nr:hypothetical protein BT69DRAFT_1290369 [Atractiella rhizophila]